MFSGSTNLLITGGNFTHIQGDNHATELNLLQQATSPNALHDSGNDAYSPKCMPNTREAIQKRIMNWTQSSNTKFVKWVRGSAGVGKTAISRSIAERCAEQGTLLAAFFFSRARDDTACLVATIAYQMILKIPESLEDVCMAINRNPLIFRLVLDTQFHTLIIDPLKKLVQSGCDKYSPPGPQLVIVLDGLDECQDAKSQVNILKMFATLLPQSPIPIRLLVASRPEQHIVAAFHAAPLDNVAIELDVNQESSFSNDIEIYFTAQFDEIKATHQIKRHIPSDWPSKSTLFTLEKKASGHFIYASTVMKYVSSPYHNPVVRLEEILTMRSGTESPLAEIRKIVTPILFFSRISLDELEAFFDYSPGDIRLRLTDLSSVIFVKEDEYGFTSGEVFHASFHDFLADPSRSKELSISGPLEHTAIVRRCFEIIRRRKPYVFRIALRLLVNHLRFAELNSQVRQDILGFSFPGFRYLYDTSSLYTYHRYLNDLPTSGGDLVPNLRRNRQSQFYRKLGSEIQKYYKNPKITLLLVLAMHHQKLFSISRDRANMSYEVAQLDSAEQALDRESLMLYKSMVDPFVEPARGYLEILQQCFVPSGPNPRSRPDSEDEYKLKLPRMSGQHYASATLVALKYVQSHVDDFWPERKENTYNDTYDKRQLQTVFDTALDVIAFALPLSVRSTELVGLLTEVRPILAIAGLDHIFPWYLAKAREQIRIFGLGA